MTDKLKDRSPAAAAILSLLLMGLGQLYNGQLRRAVVLFALDFLAAVLVVTNPTFLLSFRGVMIIWIFVGVRILAAIDAFVSARRIGKVELQRYNRWYVYVSVYLVAMIINQIVFENPVESYKWPAISNMPTLLVGDYLLANKNAYHDREPERGDIVVFKLPSDNETDYLKRLIGLPGDRIQVRKSIVHINNRPVARLKLGTINLADYGGYQQHAVEYFETLPNGVRYRVWEMGDEDMLDNTPVYEVPSGHYFFMGDNRDQSLDSRTAEVGFVPAANLIGRAEVLFFSYDGTASWWQIWRWPQAIRFSRIGKEID